MASLALRHKPDSNTTTYVQAAHFTITLPATIALQLDGSSLDLSDCLNEDDRASLKQAKDQASVMVIYRFDVFPQALPVAIPCTYDNTLFANAPHDTKGKGPTSETHTIREGTAQRLTQEHIHALVEKSKHVTVTGIMPNPDKRNA